MIEAVTFDWWNTIALTTPDQDGRLREMRVGRALEALRETRARADVTDAALFRAYDRQMEVLDAAWARNVDLPPEEQITAFLGFAGLDDADPALADAVAEAFGGALLELPPATFPHIAETLEALQRDGYRVGLVSNTGRTWGRYLRRVQDRLGIGDRFDVRVFSDEVGVRKPDPAIFRRALAELDLPPERVVHVGDDVEADVQGAKALGMRAVWFNTGRPGHRPGHGAWPASAVRQADAEVSDHAEVPALLSGWRR